MIRNARLAVEGIVLSLWICNFSIAGVWQVTNPADSGPDTLRWALETALTNPGADLVTFDLPAPYEIAPLSPLPALADPTGPTIVDGWSLPDAILGARVAVDGSSAGAVPGFLINGTNQIIRGLIIYNFQPGIRISGGLANGIFANVIYSNADCGVRIDGGRGHVIGGTGELYNTISGNDGNGLFIIGPAYSNTVVGNRIGVMANGIDPWPNLWDGIYIYQSSLNQIGGYAEDSGNIISANLTHGLSLNSAQMNYIVRNRIGVSGDGAMPRPNGQNGVQLSGSVGNTIGGWNLSERNIISGNGQHGLALLDFSDNNVVFENYIGTDYLGAYAISNNGCGVIIRSSSGNSVSRCLISGNMTNGVVIDGRSYPASDNSMVGCYVGLSADGLSPLHNQGNGVLVDCADQTSIGQEMAFYENVISANPGKGVEVRGCRAGVIAKNIIGLNANGYAPMGNGESGILLEGVTNFTISYNTIGCNSYDGVTVLASRDCRLKSNIIGLDIFQSESRPNGMYGILINSSYDTLVGGTNAGNVIAGNALAGVALIESSSSCRYNQISRNSIYSNGTLGIDLQGDGISDNDPLDSDSGANGLQNFPTLASARRGSTWVAGRLVSEAFKDYTLEFFNGSEPVGSGPRYIGSALVHTEADGSGIFNVELPQMTPLGSYITVTATDNDRHETSEFSTGVVVQAASDFDNDGMPDYWENMYGWLDASISNSATADHDGDAVPDVEEYVANSNPDDLNDYLRFRSIGVSSFSDSGVLSWYSSDQRVYDLDQTADSGDPSGWTSVWVNTWGDASIPYSIRYVTSPGAGSSLVYRVRAKLP